MCFMGVCRLLGWLPRFAYIHCISARIVGSLLFSYILYYPIQLHSSMDGCLWTVSVCLLSVCVGCLGGCLVLLTFTVYLLVSSVLFCSRIFFTILFNCILVWTVACGLYRYAFYRCVSVAWVVASCCLHSLYILSSRLFSSFLVYSLLSYSIAF